MTDSTESLKLTVTLEIEITWVRIQELLCCAFEGGSNYGYVINDFKKPTSMPIRTSTKEIFRHLDYPVNPGGALIIQSNVEEDEERYKKNFRLDRETLEKGLKILAEKFPRHFNDFRNDNDDANTGDAFLQCCLYGDIIYG